MSEKFKLAHLSDVHAGYRTGQIKTSQGINVREADGYIALNQIISDIIAEEVDALLVAGDIFHTPTPDVRTVVFVQEQLRRLWKANIKAYILTGNHDTNDVKSDVAANKLLNDPARGIYSTVQPYEKFNLSKDVFLHTVSHHMYSEQSATMKNIKPEKNGINIFSTHGSCIDPILKIRLSTDQSPREIVIPDELLANPDWSYVLLGHIHERGYPGSSDGKNDTTKRKIYYNGSTIRRGFSDGETALGRGWTLWSISDAGVFTPTYKQVAQRPQIDFDVIDAAGLSSGDISDTIIANLKATQSSGKDFDLKTAPILRQRIQNIESSKHAALDWARINANTQHALSWTTKITAFVAPQDSDDKVSSNSQQVSLGNESLNVVKAYDDWVDSSKTLESTTEDLKKTVKEQSRKFMELGQEVALNE